MPRMYPFDTEASLLARKLDNNDLESLSPLAVDGIEGKTFLANLVEISIPDRRWRKRFEDRMANLADEKRGFLGLSSNIYSISTGLNPILTLLRCLGYFPSFIWKRKRRIRRRVCLYNFCKDTKMPRPLYTSEKWRFSFSKHEKIYIPFVFLIFLYNIIIDFGKPKYHLVVLILPYPTECRSWLDLQAILMLFSLFVFLLNLYLFSDNVLLLRRYHDKFGFLHASTVSSIMSGTKPLINCWLIFLFLARLKRHVKMLRTMDGVDLSFKSAFRKTPNMRRQTWMFFMLFLMSMVVPFGWRLYEVYTDGFFILVPLLTAWNIVPLLYYHLCNNVVRYWCITLKKMLRREHFKRHYALKFYYEQFLKITVVQESIGDLFNPFILFSLAWSFMLLSLTIYFVTQPTSSLVEPITAEQVTNEFIRKRLNEKILINVGWSVIQIIVAILHICVICANGMKTNEETRNILTAVLAIVPDANADLDRFQISCFVHKMSTQYMWGMTVWRAFPLERTTFFTVYASIRASAFIWSKMQFKHILFIKIISIMVDNVFPTVYKLVDRWKYVVDHDGDYFDE